MLLERLTELYHRVHNSIDCQYMDQRSFRVRDQTMKGNANILLKAKNVNERRLRYLPVQKKVQKYDDTLEIENNILSHVCQTLCHCQSVMISVLTSRFFGGNVTILAATSLTLTSTLTADYVIVLLWNFVLFLLDTITFISVTLTILFFYP